MRTRDLSLNNDLQKAPIAVLACKSYVYIFCAPYMSHSTLSLLVVYELQRRVLCVRHSFIDCGRHQLHCTPSSLFQPSAYTPNFFSNRRGSHAYVPRPESHHHSPLLQPDLCRCSDHRRLRRARPHRAQSPCGRDIASQHRDQSRTVS